MTFEASDAWRVTTHDNTQLCMDPAEAFYCTSTGFSMPVAEGRNSIKQTFDKAFRRIFSQ